MTGKRNHLRKDEDGAVAALYALALFVLVAIAGVAWDWTRMTAMHSELQNAADQAALAAATQLDTATGACARASASAVNLLRNSTLLSNDNAASGRSITVTDEPTCDGIGVITFWKDREKVTAADSDANARFVEVTVDGRNAIFAFTPVVGALQSGKKVATAMAGLGSSVCKVPPVMVCSPDPSKPFNANARVGQGIVATGHNVGNSSNQGGNSGSGSNTTWSPGDFGFLQVDDSNSTTRNAALIKALAYANPPVDCVKVDENTVSTGNPQGLYDAINTRFDIYDFPSNSGGGNVLSSCQGGSCPPASNVIKDLTTAGISGNGCKLQNGNGAGSGWAFPSAGSEFKPVAKAGSTNATLFDDNGTISVMGLPRDNCHYTSYNGTGTCPGGTGRYGDGVWDRADYFNVNHKSGATVTYPPSWTNITRYQTYLWEIANSNIPSGNGAKSQRGKPVCFTGSSGVSLDRRVLTVAVVSNCSSLTGSSQPVAIDEWVDVFLVEPSTDDPIRYNAFKDAIYMEVIGKSKIAGSGTYGSQNVRRDVPYLVR